MREMALLRDIVRERERERVKEREREREGERGREGERERESSNLRANVPLPHAHTHTHTQNLLICAQMLCYGTAFHYIFTYKDFISDGKLQEWLPPPPPLYTQTDSD